MMVCAHCSCTNPPDSIYCAACGQAMVAAAPAAAPKASRSQTVLIVLVVGGVAAVMFAGIVAAIAIPNLLNAIDRGKQKRTIADLRSLGTAIEEYSIDNDAYPVALDIATLSGLLEPDHIDKAPSKDGWGHAFVVDASPTRYTICSNGKDGSGDCQRDDGGETDRFDDSITFADGSFVQWPEGLGF